MPTDPISVQRLDLTLSTPEENLACDEALLNHREAHGGPGILRFWESPIPFIVVGYAARVAAEVNLAACDEQRIPVLRRCSGGGTVLQGPGCVNYSLVLPLNAAGPDATITQTNCFVMSRQRDALGSLLGRPVTVSGHTDLALEDRKFSGNAQRRKRDWFLFHGTFLLASFDLALVPALLPSPPREPDYRRHRSHADFLTRLAVDRAPLNQALADGWQATTSLDPDRDFPGIRSAIVALCHGRYGEPAWNRR